MKKIYIVDWQVTDTCEPGNRRRLRKCFETEDGAYQFSSELHKASELTGAWVDSNINETDLNP